MGWRPFQNAGTRGRPRRQARPGGSDFELDRLVAVLSPLPHADGRAVPAGPAGDHAAGAGPVHVRGRPRDRQVGDTRVDGSRRWDILWVHYEAEELRVHHRTTMPSDEARAVGMAVLASGRVPPLQATRLGLQRPSAPALRRAWAFGRHYPAWWGRLTMLQENSYTRNNPVRQIPLSTAGVGPCGSRPGSCLARGLALIPVSTLIHNTKSERAGAAWQPRPEIRDGRTTDGEETVAPAAIDAGSAGASCVSPLVGRRNVTLTRWSRAPTVAPQGVRLRETAAPSSAPRAALHGMGGGTLGGARR
jgi:hypothetical protein